MKKLFAFTLLGMVLFSQTSFAQDDKSKIPSPPAKVTTTIHSGAIVTIDYSQPSVKGRIIGKTLEPMEGIVWRTGANDATVFESDKDLLVEGKSLPAGKYGLFSIVKNGEWTIIFNKTWKQWGAFQYKAADDVLRVTVKGAKAENFAERLIFSIEKSGMLTLLWGDHKVQLQLK